MGPLLEVLALAVLFLNQFDEQIPLTHRAFSFEVNPLAGMGALTTCSVYGRLVNGDFRPFLPSREEALFNVDELRTIVQAGGNFVANVVAAHKQKVGH
jgi:hypothetical protein